MIDNELIEKLIESKEMDDVPIRYYAKIVSALREIEKNELSELSELSDLSTTDARNVSTYVPGSEYGANT